MSPSRRPPSYSEFKSAEKRRRVAELFELRKERKLTAEEAAELLRLEVELGQTLMPFAR